MPVAALRDPDLISAVVSFNSTGDNTVVAAVANQQVRVYRILIVADAATTITFKDSSTALSGGIPLFAGGAFVLDISDDPWYSTTVGNGFVINQTGTAAIGGTIWYQQP